jgi:oxygen-independent coproporphyrinogen-3 oxidase
MDFYLDSFWISFIGMAPSLVALYQRVSFQSSKDTLVVLCSNLMQPYSLYLHIPFCRYRCGYCDFNTYARQEKVIPDYVSALIQEIEGGAVAAQARLPVHTIFLGGGTPSLLPPDAHRKILDTIRREFNLLLDAELTLEANPGTVSPSYLEELRKAGYTRISVGMQSSHPDLLRLLEREHTTLNVVDAVKWARKAGFNNLNLDLIYGLPYQTIPQWRDSLEFAINLNPEHLSLYALTIEAGTPLAHWVKRGLVADPDPDLAADMYEYAMDRLPEAGFMQYEISNWARLDKGGNILACRHNLQYWRNLPYLGFGAGAHGYAAGYRTANVLRIAEYIRRVNAGTWREFPFSPAGVTQNPIDRQTEMQETMMVGLRLVEEGVAAATFRDRFGLSLEAVFGPDIDELVSLGLLEWSDGSLRLTRRGRLVGNQVFMRFVGEGEPD